MAVSVTIGGETYQVPEMNFCAVERAWPYVAQCMATADPIQGSAAGICIIVAALTEDEYFVPEKYGFEYKGPIGEDMSPEDRASFFDQLQKRFKRKLRATEISLVRDAVNQITLEAGLVAEPGELEEGTEDPLSTETARDILLSSLQLDAAEETGSE